MAKGKNAAALFEVIHADKRFGKKQTAARALSTPKWWFKGKDKSPTSSAPSAAPPAHDPNDPTQSAPRFDPTLHVAAPDPTEPPRPVVNVAVNQDRQEISFKLTYTSAIVSMFALVVVLALVYIIGRRMSNGPTPVMANSAEILKGEPNTRVLEVGDTGESSEPKSNAPAPANPSTARVSPPLPPIEAAPVAPKQHAFNEDGPRIIGLNYVVAQSYPAQEKDLAEQAAKFLNDAGIKCTIEQGLAGWPASWYSVVGMKGFETLRGNAEYEAYKAEIMKVSDAYAGKSKFKRFDPSTRRWQERK
jgi:hypothetical protein